MNWQKFFQISGYVVENFVDKKLSIQLKLFQKILLSGYFLVNYGRAEKQRRKRSNRR